MWEILSFLGMVGWGIGVVVFVAVLWDRSRREALEARDAQIRRDTAQHPE